MSSICNRAGWTIGGTRDKYIKYENAGDQFLGRTLAGLNSLKQEFSISPPFFHLEEKNKDNVDVLLRSNLVGGRRCSSAMFEVLQMCLASVIYHKNFLDRTLNEKHRFWSHPLFNSLPVVST